MKKILSSIVLCAAVITGCTDENANYKALKHGARAYPHEGSVFEVAPEIGSTGAAYWCASAEYARRFLGAGWQTPIYVLRGMGHGEISGRKSTVLFTLDPVGSQSQSSGIQLTNAYHVGDTMTVQGADCQCDPFLLDLN